MSPPVPRLLAVDALRGLAALAVVFSHVPRTAETPWRIAAAVPFELGSLGVPLFLVLSGFCIHLSVARRAARGEGLRPDWFAFWRRRFVRLYPPYVVALVLGAGIWVGLSPLGPRGPVVVPNAWWDVAAHLALVHNLTANFSYGVGNPAFWTLGLEEQLYALFAIVILLRRRMPVRRVVVVTLAVMIGWRWAVEVGGFVLARYVGVPRAEQVLCVGPVRLGGWALWPFGFWFLWLLGAWAAEAHAGLVELPGWAYRRRWAALAVAVSVVTNHRTLGRYTRYWLTDDGGQGFIRTGLGCVGGLSDAAFAVACFIVLNRWVRAEAGGRAGGRWVRAAAAVGGMSYSLYLVHMPVIDLLANLTAGLPGADRYAVRLVVFPAACLAVGWAFFHGVEKHFLPGPPRPAAARPPRPGWNSPGPAYSISRRRAAPPRRPGP